MKTGIGLAICLALCTLTPPARAQEPAPHFQPPQVISTVEPNYPANSVAGGTVVLEVKVSSGGEIQNVRVLQHAKGFTKQAVEAVKKWKFQAARFNGKPVQASIPVAFSFSQPIVWWNHQAR